MNAWVSRIYLSEGPIGSWSASGDTNLTECLVSVVRKTPLAIPIPRGSQNFARWSVSLSDFVTGPVTRQL